MKSMLFALALFMLFAGCAQLAQSLPSLRYCNEVSYTRQGRDITITAHCFEAVEPAFPVPLPRP